jgi:hypothetical protein
LLQAPAETGKKRSRDESRFQYGIPSFVADKSDGAACCEFEGVTASPITEVLRLLYFPAIFGA